MDEDDYVPATATQVKVTNIIDPYHMRIYEAENHTQRLVQLEQKLQHLAKTKLCGYGNDCEPAIGDLVLIENSRDSRPFNVDLPAWCCRGVVVHGKTRDSKYPVILVDHGIVLDLWIEELRILPPSSISDEFLTTSVGINDIIPITVTNRVASFSGHWSSLAVQFTREIVAASTEIYFDHLTSDKSGNRFGELYLILENEIVPLGKSLVCNLFGTMLKDDSQEITEEPDTPAPQASATPIKNPLTSNSVGNSSEHKPDIDNVSNSGSAVLAQAFNRPSKRKHTTDPDQTILICSTVKCKPIKTVEEAGFHARLQKALRSFPISRPMSLQGYVWPAVSRGLNVVAVASPKSGKTMSYLLPVISSIVANENNTQAPGAYGPFAIILCVSSLDVHRVFETCNKLLRGCKNLSVLPAYIGISERTVVAKIYNGCDILISTPPYLSRLMKSDQKLLAFDRLSHMVFDGADVILEKYNKSLGPIIKIPHAVEKERHGVPNGISLQMIAVAQYWTPPLRILVEGFIKNPYVCIGSYMEATVYAALKPQLILQPKNQKAARVVELLGTQWSMIKTIIACTNTEEAKELAEVLKSNSIDTSLVYDEMIFTETRGIKEAWMAMVSGKYFVLVCTDQRIGDLNIKDADYLIHYSLASKTKTQFFHRFSTLIDNFSRHVISKKKRKPRFVLMADEDNDAQLNGIITMIRRLNGKIPAALEANLEQIILTADMVKTDRRLCRDLKAFGMCPNRDFCGSRHCFIPDVDKPITEIRTDDWVKLFLTGTHSVNHYAARILGYKMAGTKEWIPFSFREFHNLSVEMQKHFSNPASRRSAKVVNVGDICAIEDSPGIFKRVQILSSVNRDEITSQSVDVRYIDDGDATSVKACHLLEVPDELVRWPSHIVDIYLTGIIPFDNEPAWSPCADGIVRQWFNENLAYPASCVFGKVLLHIGHMMWVSPLEIRHELQGFPDLVDATLKATLIEEKCALENKAHIENLLDLCRKSNIITERTKEVTE